jgi:hypothetical protein
MSGCQRQPGRADDVLTAHKPPARLKPRTGKVAKKKIKENQARKTTKPALNKTKSKSADRCQNWTAQFIYADAAGDTQISLMTIEAKSADSARRFAAAHAPAEEFMVSVYPCSDEQFLGQVRLKALDAAGK